MSLQRDHPLFTISHKDDKTRQTITLSTAPLQVQPTHVFRHAWKFTSDYKQAKAAFESQQGWKDCKPVSDFIKRNYVKRKPDQPAYLDYGGAGQPMQSVLDEEHAFLKKNVLGNPHSASASSQLASKYVDLARNDVLKFFGVTDVTHECIWTSGTSGALSLLRTLYFETTKRERIKTRLLIIDDVHNSVNGIRTVASDPAMRELVEVCFVPLDIATLRVDEQIFGHEISKLRSDERGLVLFTAQSNISGVQQNFRRLLMTAKQYGWDTMLDAAAFVPTSYLDLAACSYIDFVPCSWYKVVGHPTGLGSLIVRRGALPRLTKAYFAGGTVEEVSNLAIDTYRLHLLGFAHFEDGTINFRSFPALHFGLARILSLPRGLIAKRVRLLLTWLVINLEGLKHSSTGHPVVRVVSFPLDEQGRSVENHGSTVSLVFYDEHGRKIPSPHIEQLAIEAGLEIREGCMCNVSARVGNPGTSGYWGDVPDELAMVDWKYDMASNAWKLEDIGEAEIGVRGLIRVSLGLPSSFRDVYNFHTFVKQLLNKPASLLVKSTSMHSKADSGTALTSI